MAELGPPDVGQPKCPECGQLAVQAEQSTVRTFELGRMDPHVGPGSSIGLAPSYSCANGHYFNEDGEPHSAPQTITIDKRWPRV